MFLAHFAWAALLTGLPILLLALAAEFFWRKNKNYSELTRKFLHISAGIYAAFWPWLFGWRIIELLALGFLAALVLSRAFTLFKSMHSARTHGFGEMLAAVSIGLVALLTHDKAIYTLSILELGLADGVAAVIGKRFGKSTSYKILGAHKSVVGTAAFFVVSAALLAAYVNTWGVNQPGLAIFALAALLTLVENISSFGVDNLLVPLICMLALELLK